MYKVLVTGSNGYIGRNVCRYLNEKGYRVLGSVRSFSTLQKKFDDIDYIETGEINGQTDWSRALSGVDIVIHLAARAHIIKDTEAESLKLFMETNCNGTINLAEQACSRGVKRFIYVSSIGVLGNSSGENPFSNTTIPSPKELYALSKLRAEEMLYKLSKECKMKYVIVRPPLVYGKGAPGNFSRLLDLINKSTFLPFGCFNSKKSMISLDNLTDFLVYCVESDKVVNRTFVVSDGKEWSTSQLVERIAKYMDKKIINIPVPIFILRLLANLVGQKAAISKLSNVLVIDSTQTMSDLAWTPPQLPEDGLKEAVQFYMEQKNKK